MSLVSGPVALEALEVTLRPSVFEDFTGQAKVKERLEITVEAARQRATVGEISDALEREFSRHRAVNQSIAGVYGAAWDGDQTFTDVQHAVSAFAEREGRLLAIQIPSWFGSTSQSFRNARRNGRERRRGRSCRRVRASECSVPGDAPSSPCTGRTPLPSNSTETMPPPCSPAPNETMWMRSSSA